jgi:hypothetical protein
MAVLTTGSVATQPAWMNKEQWDASKAQREAAARELIKQIEAIMQDMVKVLPKSVQQELAKLNAASREADAAVAKVQQELEVHRNNPPSDMADVREYAVRKIELEASLPILQKRAADARRAKDAVAERARELLRAEHSRRRQDIDAEIERIRQDAERAIEDARARYRLLEEAAGRLQTYEGA